MLVTGALSWEIYAKLGFGPQSGVDFGSPTMYDVWNDVHTAALEDYRISGADLFCPGGDPVSDDPVSDRQVKLLAIVAEGRGLGRQADRHDR